MKALLLTSTFLLLSTLAFSQLSALEGFNDQRLQRQKTGMLVLGGWAVANIAGGLALSTQREGSEKYFHQMNAGWNIINLGIAGLGYLTALKVDPSSLSLYESIQEQHKFQKILLLNAGLDVGYVLGGLYLTERSKNTIKNPDRLKGFGQAIMLQGAFLFVFDLVNYAIHALDNPKLEPLIGSLQLGKNGLGIVWQF